PALAAALGVAGLWLKREDRAATPGGGNKVRGLEFLLAGVPSGAVFVTAGGTGSTHCLCTAVHAGARGHRTVLAQFRQPATVEPPDSILLPLGTGGTAAGVALAVVALGWPTRVVGVRVAPAVVANRARTWWLAYRAGRLLAARGTRIPHLASRFPLSVVDGLGGGYGHPTPEGEAAGRLASEHGLTLDPTYGAKAFAHVMQRATRNVQRVGFWH